MKTKALAEVELDELFLFFGAVEVCKEHEYSHSLAPLERLQEKMVIALEITDEKSVKEALLEVIKKAMQL
jgi:hypothetical protein